MSSVEEPPSSSEMAAQPEQILDFLFDAQDGVLTTEVTTTETAVPQQDNTMPTLSLVSCSQVKFLVYGVYTAYATIVT